MLQLFLAATSSYTPAFGEPANEGKVPLSKKKIAIVGATGAVGEELIDVLRRRNFPLAELRLYASKKSAGQKVNTSLGVVEIEEFTVAKARECDLVFFATTGGHALEVSPTISLCCKI